MMKRLYFNMAMAVLLGVSAASCTDGNDWDVDGSHSRLFGVNDSKISIDTEEFQATVEFASTPGAEYYIIEVSTDSLYDEIPMGGENAIIYGEDKSMTKSPVVLTNLTNDTRYYMRIKAMSSVQNESRWVYYRNGATFKTKAEQIFNEVKSSDRYMDHICLSWIPGAEVTNIVVSVNGELVRDIILDDEAKAAGEYVVEGLNPSTPYTFVIYNGDAKRGTLTISTTAAIPTGDYTYILPEGTTAIDQDMINMIAEEAMALGDGTSVSATIGIPADTEVDVRGLSDAGSATTIKLPDGLSVTFFGMAGGDRPVLKFPKSLDIGGGRTYIHFENVNITDSGCQYLINQTANGAMSELSFKECNIYDFERSLVRTQGSCVLDVENIVVDDCILTNMSTGNGYAMFYFGTSGTHVGKLELKNSTFDTSQHSLIQASNAPITEGVFITNCTFYNNVTDGKYLMDANGQATNLTMTNTILGKSYVATAKGVRTSGTMTFNGCLRASDCKYTSNEIKLEADEMKSAEIFKDPANHDFTLKISENIGDPRWWYVED